jgi:hypothetical protein
LKGYWKSLKQIISHTFGKLAYFLKAQKTIFWVLAKSSVFDQKSIMIFILDFWGSVLKYKIYSPNKSLKKNLQKKIKKWLVNQFFNKKICFNFWNLPTYLIGQPTKKK